MNAMTFSKKEEVKAWEQEFVPCEHTLCLVQQDIENPESKGIQFIPPPPFGPGDYNTNSDRRLKSVLSL